MPLILYPSFDDHTRAQVELHLEQVRLRRLAGALEYQQSKMLKLEKGENELQNKLIRHYEQMGKASIDWIRTWRRSRPTWKRVLRCVLN